MNTINLAQAQDSFNNLVESLNNNQSVIALRELGTAITIVFKDEKRDLLNDIFTKDLKPKYESGKSVVHAVKNLGQKALAALKTTKQRVQCGEGKEILQELQAQTSSAAAASKQKIKEAFHVVKNTIPEAKKQIVSFMDNLIQEYNSLENAEDKSHFILKMFLYILVLAKSFSVGNHLPDKDFSLWGAGNHRSFLSHSVLPYLVILAVLTLGRRILERADLHLSDGSEGKKLNQTVINVFNLVGIGVGTGMAWHLLMDGLVDRGGTIRIHDLQGNNLGTLIRGTRVDDMAYVLANSLFTWKATKTNVA